MRRIFCLIGLATIAVAILTIPLAQAQPPRAESPVPVLLAGTGYRWSELGTITSQQDVPAVADRDYTTVLALADAKVFVWNIENWGRKAQMSFQTTADADSTTIVLLAFADRLMRDQYGTLSLGDDAVYGGQLVLTGGKQVGSHSNVYVDTIVATDGIFGFGVSDSAADRRCVVSFQTCGFQTIVGIATTLQASSTLYAYGRLY